MRVGSTKGVLGMCGPGIWVPVGVFGLVVIVFITGPWKRMVRVLEPIKE